jgi:hypothetical protein
MLKPEEEEELIGDDSSPASCAADEHTEAASAVGQAEHQVGVEFCFDQIFRILS